VEADIWLHESLGEFVSEFGFGNDSSLPLSVATFSREPTPTVVAISHIYSENPEGMNSFGRAQGHPDVSECLDQTPLLLRIILQGRKEQRVNQELKILWVDLAVIITILDLKNCCI